MSDQFEFVGFDACLMGTVETAGLMASYARYMVASQETEPGCGWEYMEKRDRSQISFLPECVEDYIDEENQLYQNMVRTDGSLF